MNCTSTTQRLTTLRQLMKNTAVVPKPLHAYIIPSEDAHLSEYTAECDQRRAFISGFMGSMATAVVTERAAALWTDGRYYIQAAKEMDNNWTLMKQGLASTPKEATWLVQHFKEHHSSSESGGSKCIVGADPLLLNHQQWDTLSHELVEAGHELVPVEQNLIDQVWGDEQPARSAHPVTILEDCWTGRNRSQKILDVRNNLKEKDCCALVLTALDDVAYLLNLRGSDIPYNPLFFSYCVVTLDSCDLFVDPSKVSPPVLQLLQSGEVKISVQPYEQFLPYIKQFCSGVVPGSSVWVPNRCSQAVCSAVPKTIRHSAVTPVALAKAIKNDTEIKGMEACHVRDGAAVCSFLAWLEEQAPTAQETEMTAATYLEQCREKQEHYRGLSFPTITSVGSNAAIVHYQTSPATDKPIDTQHIYLVDSGAHYSDGTTDVTRTVHFGTPSSEERDASTRVLKGHIAMAVAVFPSKIKGNCLDSFARQFLWSVGLDYGHGTSHGVGMFLNVHEGPMGISWRVYPDDPGLQEGMFLSDEPGYYKNGDFGVRIESIVRIVKADTPHRHNDLDFLTFKVTTMVPIQAKLIDTKLLTQQEVSWINNYHTTVLATVGPVLQKQGDQRAYDWLVRETQPLSLS